MHNDYFNFSYLWQTDKPYTKAYSLHIISTTFPYHGIEVISKQQSVTNVNSWTSISNSYPSWSHNYSSGLYNYRIDIETISSGETYYAEKTGTLSIVKDIYNLNTSFSCIPSGILECTFGDMINAQYGFIYPTQEDIANWSGN